MSEWERKDFSRRGYYVEDGSFTNKQIEIVVKVGGKLHSQLVLGEPGLVAVISHPDEDGLRIEVIRPDGVAYTDMQTPQVAAEQKLLDWQAEVLGVK